MDLEKLTREQLVARLRELKEYMDNVIVFWGGKKELRETFREVADNKESEYTQDEARNAGILINNDAAYDELVEMIRDSFDRGGISYAVSEKISALMEEVGTRYR